MMLAGCTCLQLLEHCAIGQSDRTGHDVVAAPRLNLLSPHSLLARGELVASPQASFTLLFRSRNGIPQQLQHQRVPIQHVPQRKSTAPSQAELWFWRLPVEQSSFMQFRKCYACTRS